MVFAGRFASLAHSAMPSGSGSSGDAQPGPTFGRLRDDQSGRGCDERIDSEGLVSGRDSFTLRNPSCSVLEGGGRRPQASRSGIARSGAEGIYFSSSKIPIRDRERARTDAALGCGMPERIVSAADDDRQPNRP
jgi:hypothetical protein